MASMYATFRRVRWMLESHSDALITRATRDESVRPPSTPLPPRMWAFTALTSAFFAVFLFVWAAFFVQHGTELAALILVAALIVVIIGACELLLFCGREWLERNRRVVIAVGVILVLALQLLYVRQLYVVHDWDPRPIMAAAMELSHFNDSSLAASAPAAYVEPGFPKTYLAAYPNNMLLVFVYELVFRACVALGIPYAVYLCICLNVLVLDAAIILAVVCAWRLWGGSAGRMTLLLAVPLLGFSPWISVAYSDTLATVLPVLLLYLYLRYLESTARTQMVLVAAMGAVSAVGYLLKPHVLAMSLAIAVVHFAAHRSGSSAGARIRKLLLCLIAALVVLGVFDAYRDYRLRTRLPEHVSAQSAFPMTHIIAMGMKGQGGWNEQDVHEQYEIATADARQRHNLQLIENRLRAFGVQGYARHLARKLVWISTDGTFYWQGEGRFSKSPVMHRDPLARALQSVFFPNGAHHRWFQLIVNAAWLLILTALVAPLATRRRGDTDWGLLVARTSVVLLLLMLLVLEGRSRYLISFLPVFMLLAAYLLGMLAERYRRRSIV